jgi:hypothetical protein
MWKFTVREAFSPPWVSLSVGQDHGRDNVHRILLYGILLEQQGLHNASQGGAYDAYG